MFAGHRSGLRRAECRLSQQNPVLRTLILELEVSSLRKGANICDQVWTVVE